MPIKCIEDNYYVVWVCRWATALIIVLAAALFLALLGLAVRFYAGMRKRRRATYAHTPHTLQSHPLSSATSLRHHTIPPLVSSSLTRFPVMQFEGRELEGAGPGASQAAAGAVSGAGGAGGRPIGHGVGRR